MASITFPEIVEWVEQLPLEQQHTLLMHLLSKPHMYPISTAERKALFEAMVVDLGAVSPAYSDRREDWYD